MWYTKLATWRFLIYELNRSLLIDWLIGWLISSFIHWLAGRLLYFLAYSDADSINGHATTDECCSCCCWLNTITLGQSAVDNSLIPSENFLRHPLPLILLPVCTLSRVHSHISRQVHALHVPYKLVRADVVTVWSLVRTADNISVDDDIPVKPGFHSNAIACVGKQPIMVATASTEHSYWLALVFVAWSCVSCGFRLRNARNASNCVWMETGLQSLLTSILRSSAHAHGAIVAVTCVVESVTSARVHYCQWRERREAEKCELMQLRRHLSVHVQPTAVNHTSVAIHLCTSICMTAISLFLNSIVAA